MRWDESGALVAGLMGQGPDHPIDSARPIADERM